MVGLTGGIGAGKSAVAPRLAERGAVIIDADRLAREVVAAGTDGLAEVVAAFGAGVLGPDGELDRPALGRRVFGDDAARRRLEAIIHPRVRARTAELGHAAPADAIVVNDVPLLVEAGLAPTYHLVVVVLAAERTRIRRLAETRGMTASRPPPGSPRRPATTGAGRRGRGDRQRRRAGRAARPGGPAVAGPAGAVRGEPAARPGRAAPPGRCGSPTTTRPGRPRPSG